MFEDVKMNFLSRLSLQPNSMNELFRLLPKLLKEFDENPSVRQAVVFAAWRQIAGESLNEHAVPFELDQKRLVIAVTGERWAKYLKDLAGQMIFKINSALGNAAVTFIDFQVNEEAVTSDRAKRTSKTFDEAELHQIAIREVSPKLRGQADSIKDENLRREFLAAAGNCLARKIKMKNI